MKIDMSSSAVAGRLKTVESLRRACISLAGSSVGLAIQKKFPDNAAIQRTASALNKKKG